MALYSVVFLGSTPIGGPIVGWLAEVAGPRSGLVLAGIAAIAAGDRRLDRLRPRPRSGVQAPARRPRAGRARLAGLGRRGRGRLGRRGAVAVEAGVRISFTGSNADEGST